MPIIKHLRTRLAASAVITIAAIALQRIWVTIPANKALQKEELVIFPRPCDISILQGRRVQLEDYAACNPNLAEVQGKAVSYYAVFDGHEGNKAADFAAQQLHMYLAAALTHSNKSSVSSVHTVLEEALAQAFQETNTGFLEHARQAGLPDGTTAVVAIGIGSRLVIAHAGDSRAVLCSITSPYLPASAGRPPAAGQNGAHLASVATLLTEDHQPGNTTEKDRILAAGGSVEQSAGGRWRLQGELSVSRSLGDLPYTTKGLIAQPTISPWIELNTKAAQPEAELLILASDGLFETMTADDICSTACVLASGGVLHKTVPAPEALPLPAAKGTAPTSIDARELARLPPGPSMDDVVASSEIPSTVTSSNGQQSVDEPTAGKGIASWLAEEAYNRRSMDNIAVVVVDLRPAMEPTTSSLPKPYSTTVEVAARAASGVSMSPEDEVTIPGRRHAYRLHAHITALPQQQHFHGHEDFYVTLRQGDKLEPSWGRAMPWAGICQADLLEPQAIEQNSHRLLALESAEDSLVSKLATVPLPPASPFTGNLGGSRVGSSGTQFQHFRSSRRQPWGQGDTLGEHWQLGGQLGRGSFGDVWHATRVEGPPEDVAEKAVLTGRTLTRQQLRLVRDFAEGASSETPAAGFVLKRMRLVKHDTSRMAYLREAYFGERVNSLSADHPACILDVPQLERSACYDLLEQGYQHLVRFVEAFEAGHDFWLVFRDEGTSLHNLIYTVAAEVGSESSGEPSHGVLLQASPWWSDLRASNEGDEVIRDLLRQLLMALNALHASNITHRDVKPENLLVQQTSSAQEGNHTQLPRFHLRLIDMGSAVDSFSTEELYGATGPSTEEHTQEYAPPEALLGRYWSGKPVVRATWPYDSWSAGVTWLELLFATPHVFSISERMRILLEQALHLDQQPQEERELAYWLRGVMQLCIYPPRPDTKIRETRPSTTAAHNLGGSPEAGGAESKPEGLPVAWSCAEEAVMAAIREKDPLQKGLPSPVALRLLQGLLHWNPASRPTPGQALKHAYFTVPLAQQHGYKCHADLEQDGWC